jgi:low temperature requirement protein LtrA
MKIINPQFKPVIFRDDKGHRGTTWLELFFDLAVVISIAALSSMFVKNPTFEGLAVYAALFFSVFWAWNQLTWYAAHFDNDDVFFRVMFMSAILSVLILAASIEKISHENTKLFVASYVLIQFLLAAGWIRVYINNPKLKSFALKILIGPVIGGIIWLVSLGFPIPQQYYVWAVAMMIQVFAPYIAWKTKTFEIPIHFSHIMERYCLLTIIVLGEILVAASVGVGSDPGSETFLIAVFGFVIAACIWWTYFGWDFINIIKFKSDSKVFWFGYGHFVVFLVIAAFGVGLDIAIHSAEHGGHSTLLERMLVGFSPSLYLVSISVLNRLSWDMTFDKKMKARIVVAILSFIFVLATGQATPVVFVGGIALLMVCLVIFEQLFCTTTQDK